MTSRIGVLLLTPFFRPNVGGAETHMDDLCRYLRTRGYRVYVLTYQPLTTRARGPSLEREENLEVHRLSWFGYNWFHKLEPYPLLQFLYLTPGLFIYALYFMSRRSGQVDVIHAHGLAASFVAASVSRLYRKRSVMSTHAIYNLKENSYLSHAIRRILSPFNAVLTLCQQSKDELVRIGVKEEKIKVYTYWVDQDIFKPLNREECKREVGWEGRFVVLFVGRLLKIKGVELLLKAARLIERDIYFAFVGDGPCASLLQRVSSDNIFFVGSVDNHLLPKYYNASDLVIVPSQYEEGYGRVILEALSCGTPVIASNRGGIREAMDSSVGMLIEPTVEEIKEKVEFLFDNSEKIQSLARNCRSYAENRFGPGNAQLIEECYHICNL